MRTVKVKKITRVQKEVTLYDIGVKDNNNFFIKPKNTNKSILVHNCHQLTPQAAELLLKPLEEPFEHVVFVLCTTNPEKLKTTLRSRCRQFEITPLEESELVSFLLKICKKEKVKFKDKKALKKALKIIAANSQYMPRVALQVLGKVLPDLKAGDFDENSVDEFLRDKTDVPPYKVTTDYLQAVYSGNYEEAFKALQSLNPNALFIFPKFLLEHHNAAVLRFVVPKLAPKDWMSQQVYKKLDKYNKIPKILLASISQRIAKYKAMTVGFEADTKTILISMTLELIENTKTFKKK